MYIEKSYNRYNTSDNSEKILKNIMSVPCL